MMIPDNRTPTRQSADELDRWLDAVSTEMGGTSRHVAHHALRGVLTALRDSLPLTDAHHLALHLPLLVRTLYYQGYRPSERPIPKGYADFIAHVRAEIWDGGSDQAEAAAAAVTRVLARFVGEAEVERLLAQLPDEVRALSREDAIAA